MLIRIRVAGVGGAALLVLLLAGCTQPFPPSGMWYRLLDDGSLEVAPCRALEVERIEVRVEFEHDGGSSGGESRSEDSLGIGDAVAIPADAWLDPTFDFEIANTDVWDSMSVSFVGPAGEHRSTVEASSLSQQWVWGGGAEIFGVVTPDRCTAPQD